MYFLRALQAEKDLQDIVVSEGLNKAVTCQ